MRNVLHGRTQHQRTHTYERETEGERESGVGRKKAIQLDDVPFTNVQGKNYGA